MIVCFSKELMHEKKVLVVEDNMINQKVATKMLTSLGCSVTVRAFHLHFRS
jgi:CheY-like chemotaxis protein